MNVTLETSYRLQSILRSRTIENTFCHYEEIKWNDVAFISAQQKLTKQLCN